MVDEAAEPRFAAEIEDWFAQADASDRDEDSVDGEDMQGDEMPAWVADKQARLARVQAAKAALEAEARGDKTDDDPDGPGPSSGVDEERQAAGRGRRGAQPDRATQLHRPRQPYPAGPVRLHRRLQCPDRGRRPRPDHRLPACPDKIQPSRRAEAAAHQPARHLERKPEGRSAGRCGLLQGREANLAHLARRGIDAYVATGRAGKAQSSNANPIAETRLQA